MAEAPLFSTFTLFTEIVVTVLILYVFYSGYKNGKYPYRIALAALVYETAFNVSYMAYRAVTHVDVKPGSAFHVALAAFHGVFSLLMFVALIVFQIAAWRSYKKNVNYFSKHKNLTITFIILWLIAIFSGVLFYIESYILS